MGVTVAANSAEPSAWRNGGAGVRIAWTVSDTSLGPILLASTGKGICRLSFDEDEHDLRRRFPNADIIAGGSDHTALVDAAILAIQHSAALTAVPFDIEGTGFQMSIWQALLNIPAGETRSYADIAAAVGKPNAVRAAGAANGANPIAVLIPCHRVIRSDGGLGGYAYGLERKRRLLALEGGQGSLFSV
jgi:AraC family transcriptional regulator of adaptative response/methylated-DNA-[protein]-cysteine methyltransferase